ncbi:2OG-Fe(II) oxygenase [Alteromonadaceae bacterium BrNp21-10]|nr:2OG-Fe(II) oxygenase [Alteromonadaceae bacterium BrNp21-10]
MATVVFNANTQTIDFQVAIFERIAVALEKDGYAVIPNALPETISNSLLDYIAYADAQAHFHPAAVGRGTETIHSQFIRRDNISWIAEEEPYSKLWLDWSTELQRYLNRRLFLGLFSFESHIAHYQPGDFYKTHVDAFKGESNRVLSLVSYLNRGWEPDQGGELVIYAPNSNQELLRVTPNFGTLVIFLSEEFPHQVRTANRDRFSVAGWFRVNGSNTVQVDPPR